MKRKLIIGLLLILTAVVALVPSRDVPVALASGEAITKWVIAGGGGSSSSGNITLQDTMGQPIIGPSSGTSTGLYAGYWYALHDPTAVMLASLAVAPQSNALVLRWTTVTEIGALGFNIYRATSRTGTQTKLNPNLIPPRNLGGLVEATYTYLDSNIVVGTTYYYWLEEVPVSGAPTRYGPVIGNTSGGFFLPFVTK
jgi:hypothetical protein